MPIVHRLAVLSATLVASGLFSHAASAQAPTATSSKAPTFDRAALAEEIKAALKDELREELKAEIKAELAAETELTGGVQDDSWAEEEWKWEEPAKPSLNFLEFDGFFRFRYDFFHNLDLDTYFNNSRAQQQSGPFSPTVSPPVPLCETDPDCAAGRDPDSIGGANMRLRLEPTFNVFEDIKIKMQVDVLDNVVLGSTPDGFPINDFVPLLGFSQTQITPSDGVNALVDSVRVKRLWAEIMTPLGQLRVGRMPSHWGMGLLANEGQGLDSDFGDSNDRIMFATQIAGHYIIPAFDWAVSGPTSAFRGQPQGQPFDRDQRDDVDQYILAVAKRDKDKSITEMLENDETVINYGLYGVYREQALDAGNFFKSNDPNSQNSDQALIPRGLSMWAYSAWFKLYYRKLTVEFETAGIVGHVDDIRVAGEHATSVAKNEVDVAMFTAATQLEYKLLHDALTLRLMVVMASGDDAPGWGVQPLATSPNAGDWDGGQDNDGKIYNFRLDPDFRVDLIFWRQLVGMVTDAIIFKPGVQYNITDGFGVRLDLIYSRAWFASSTPSASGTGQNIIALDPSANLGLETDLKIFYASEDGFHAWLEYGLFVPFAGLDRIVIDENQQSLLLSSSVAQTIQAMLAVKF